MDEYEFEYWKVMKCIICIFLFTKSPMTIYKNVSDILITYIVKCFIEVVLFLVINMINIAET